MKVNVLICSCIDFSKISAAKNRVLRMAHSLRLFGVECTIVGISSKEYSEEIIENNIKLISIKHISKKSNFYYSKLLKHSFGCSASYKEDLPKVLGSINVDLIISYTYLSSVSSALLEISKKHNIKIVFDMVENFRFDFHKFFNGMYFQQKIFMYRDAVSADGLISISNSWVEWCNRRDIRTTHIPGFMPYKKPINIPAKCTDKKSNLFAKNKIVFLGKFNTREQFWKILQSVSLCKKNHGIDVDLVIIGKKLGGAVGFLIDFYINHFSSISLKYTGLVDDLQRDCWLKKSDLFILLRANNKETSFSFPTRFPEYLSFNKPIIISPTSDFLSLAQSHKDVYLLTSNNPSEISNCISLILKSRSRTNHAKLTNKLSSKVMGKKLFLFITSLCNE